MKKKLMLIPTLLFALVLTGFSIYSIKADKKIEYIETVGKIVAIDKEYDQIEGEWHYKVFIDYEANGKEYRNKEYGSYDFTMKIGDEVTVYYDVAKPENIQPKGYAIVPYIVLGASIIMYVVVGVVLFKR